jgi:ribosomal protein L25 (general stress protein Ctc)
MKLLIKSLTLNRYCKSISSLSFSSKILQNNNNNNNNNSSISSSSSSSSGSGNNSNNNDDSLPILIASLRSSKDNGSRPSRRLREEGMVPGVIYGKYNNMNNIKIQVSLPMKDIKKELRVFGNSFENRYFDYHYYFIIYIIIIINIIIIIFIIRLYQIDVLDDKKDKLHTYKVTPRQVQINPLTDDPLNVNYLIYSPGQRVRIPLEYINHDMSNDLKRGCFVYRINRFLECYCDADYIPTSLKVDLTGKAKGDVIRIDCTWSEISPDFTNEMREACRQLRATNNLQKPK